MQFNRAQVKMEAKEAIRQSNPKATMVTFVYLMLVGLISFVISMMSMVPTMTALFAAAQFDLSPAETLAAVSGGSFLSMFISILVGLYVMVMNVGYIQYAMNLRRGQPAGYGNLFSGFSRVGHILAVNILIGIFGFLWSILGGVVFGVIIGISVATGSPGIIGAVFFLAYIGMFAFVINRVLRYSMANYILLDRPELGALACISESKRIMKGNLWKYFVLGLSFIGWYLLMMLVMYIVLIPGMLFAMGGGTPNPGVMIVVFILAFLVSTIVGMWLSAYIQVTDVGFYDCIKGDGGQVSPEFAPPTYQPPTYVPPVERTPEPEPDPTPEPEMPLLQPEASDEADGAPDGDSEL